jgi:hypothetical protein
MDGQGPAVITNAPFGAGAHGQAAGVLRAATGVQAIWFPWLLPGLHVSSMPAM